MSTIIKNVKGYIIITLCMIIAFVGLKMLAYCVPDEPVKKNIVSSVEYMQKEGIYPSAYADDEYNLYSQRLDNCTDVIFLNVIYNMRKTNCLEAILCDYRGVPDGDTELDKLYNVVNSEDYSLASYGRQWFGSISFLRILLAVFTLPQIRILSQYFMFILLGLSVLLISKKVDYKIAVLFLLNMSVISLDVVAASVNHAGAFYSLLLGVIMVCLLHNKVSDYMIIYIVGGITAYFDLFSLPFVTPLVAIFVLYMDYKEEKIFNFKSGFFRMMYLAIFWIAGYVVLWMGKWLLASIAGRRNIFADAIIEMGKQSVNKSTIDWGPETTSGYIVESIKLCLENMFPINYFKMAYQNGGKTLVLGFVMILLLLLILFFVRYHKKIGQLWFSCIMIIIACFPYLCYVVMHTHAFIHFWMWFRMQLITWMAIGLAYLDALDFKRQKSNMG